METRVSADQTKRIQKDYSLPFKLEIIEEVEKGKLIYKKAQRKYWIQGLCYF